MKKKIIAAALICSIMLSVFTVPSSAVLTETVIAGGLIAAYMAAVGITVVVDNRSDSELGQWIYDRFQNWVDNTGTAITAGNLIAGIAIQNGQIKIQNGISKVLSRFMPELTAVNISTGYADIQGIGELPIYHVNATNIDYSGLTEQEEQNITLVMHGDTPSSNDGTYNPVYFRRVIKDSTQGSAYYPYYHNGTGYRPLSTGRILETGTDVVDNTVLGYKLCIMIGTDGRRYFGAVYPYRLNGNDKSKKLHFVGISDYYLDLIPNASIETGEITVPLPSESLLDDEDTLIDIGVPVTSVSDAAEKALATTIGGTISATYTNSNPIPPVPETNLSWVRSLHSIWEYVEYLIDQASAGFSFFSGLLAALPVEVEFCFYGALVLLLFGGVISRLLL